MSVTPGSVRLCEAQRTYRANLSVLRGLQAEYQTQIFVEHLCCYRIKEEAVALLCQVKRCKFDFQFQEDGNTVKTQTCKF